MTKVCADIARGYLNADPLYRRAISLGVRDRRIPIASERTTLRGHVLTGLAVAVLFGVAWWVLS